MADFDFERARYLMIEQQLRTWSVLDERVLDVIRTTPREDFVPERYRTLAFTDMQIPLDYGQVMMEPKVEARLLQEVDPQPDEQVLQLGVGAGYLTACLAKLAAHVTAVDSFAEFVEGAAAKLKAHGIDNVTVIKGDPAAWEDGRRYDVIVVTGSVPEVPESLKRSLNVGGRLFAVVGKLPIMEALVIARSGENDWSSESLFDTALRPLPNLREVRSFAL